MKHTQGRALELAGDWFQRGLAQARLATNQIEHVRDAVCRRLLPVAKDISGGPLSGWLRDQRDYACTIAPDEINELRGIAEGYSLSFDDLFAYLHLGVIHDMLAMQSATSDGCTAWAAGDPVIGGVVAKNRDFRGEHLGLQRVFLHRDPEWGARRILCVGSLGSPGAYSSGINSDGFAVADTQIGTSDHGVGLLRYFVMTRLLVQAGTVSEALEIVSALQHAGGGSLVMADARGDVAAVELGHRRTSVSKPANDWVARTNHFLSVELAKNQVALPEDPMWVSSTGRLKTVEAAVAAWMGNDLSEASSLMACHGELSPDGKGETAGLCRHGEDGDARTISTSLFTCNPPSLYFCPGNPCHGEWLSYEL